MVLSEIQLSTPRHDRSVSYFITSYRSLTWFHNIRISSFNFIIFEIVATEHKQYRTTSAHPKNSIMYHTTPFHPIPNPIPSHAITYAWKFFHFPDLSIVGLWDRVVCLSLRSFVRPSVRLYGSVFNGCRSFDRYCQSERVKSCTVMFNFVYFAMSQ